MRFPWEHPARLRTVIVNLKDAPDTALRGALWECRGAWITLRRVEVLTVGNAAQPIDGEVVIERSNVAFMQVMP